MKNIIFILALIISINSYGQRIGVRAGFALYKIDSLNSAIQPTLGIFLQTKGDTYFNGEVNFRTVAGTVNVKRPNSNQTELKKYIFQYIEVPLLIGYKGKKHKINPFINAGVSPSYLLNSKYDGGNVKAESFNIGIIISPGLMMSDKVSLELRLNKSTMAIYRRHNFTSFAFILGYRFN